MEPTTQGETDALLGNEHAPLQQRSSRKSNIIEFDPNGDPDNPLDWKTWYRWSIVLLLAFMAFTVTFTCVGIVPVANTVIRDLTGHRDKSATVLFVTIWELGEAAGPLFIAPLSEVFGRYPVFNVANTLFVAGIVMTAASQSTGVLIFARFLTGCAVAGNVLNPAVVGDLFPPKSRGSAMSAVMLAPLLGGAVGPAVAGALAKETGWREVMWLAVGLAGTCEVCFLLLFRETYKVAILQRRAKRLRKETGDESLRTEYDGEGKRRSQWSIILASMVRPAEVFFGSFILQILSLWGALVFAFFYVFSTTLPDTLEDVYGFDEAQRGVAFLSFSLGSSMAIAVASKAVDKIYNALQARRAPKSYPEGRLPLPIASAFTLPFIIVLYGYAPDQHWPVWVLLLSVVLFGFPIMLSIVPTLTYVTDAFGLYSASALTAVLITRCLVGTFLPLAVPPLIAKLGYGLGFLILAAACLALAPIPALVMRYGPRWRQWSRYTMDE